MKRTLGRSGIEVSAMGLGCWAIGGPYTDAEGKAVGWGEVDDDESRRAVQRGIDLGVTFFDTAACYGAGHSERVLGEAIAGRRDQVVIATKFGHTFDESARQATGSDHTVTNLLQSVDASLQRLNTDRIDVLQFHLGGYDHHAVDLIVDALEELVSAGKVRCYGWSTDDPDRAAKFAKGKHCAVVQQHLNVLEGNLETLAVAEREKLASINRGPLAKAVLTGKFEKGQKLPDNDVRHKWDTANGAVSQAIDVVDAIRDVLTSDGRTPAQGAIAWLWARSEVTIPIPGFKTVQQVQDNAGAMDKGPLTADQMQQIDDLLTEAGWQRQRFA
jgi:aryl-alcohol dehydrogenase-like predicted oxidoreductase